MKLTFLGAAGTVTGSCFLLETDDRKVLIDCGMFQGSKLVRAFNYREFAFAPASLDAVLLTHAHIDHSGLLPKLTKQGFKGPIYATKVTAELCGIMLPDSAYIQESDAAFANRKGQRAGKKKVEPLYDMDDCTRCLRQFLPVAYNADVEIGDGIKAVFYDAGHMLGSAIVQIDITEHGNTTRLLFSGDLGQPDQPIVKDPTYVCNADFIVLESTYGNRHHEHYDKEAKLAEIVNATANAGGNIIIPSFAVGRTQLLLYYLYRLYRSGRIPDIPVIIDSPLAISATDIFFDNSQEFDSEAYAMLVEGQQHAHAMPQLKFTKTAEESKALNSLPTPAIIISASGMADAGRILHHLKHNLWRPESSVLFVGYQAEGSLGRRLIEGAGLVRIMGEDIKVKAAVYNLEGFSAHADQQQLLEWLEYAANPKPANVFLVHGESLAAQTLSERIDERLHVSSTIPAYGDAAIITGRQWQLALSPPPVVQPDGSQLEEYLAQMEAEYRLMRDKLLKTAGKQPTKVAHIITKLEKAFKYLKKLIKEL